MNFKPSYFSKNTLFHPSDNKISRNSIIPTTIVSRYEPWPISIFIFKRRHKFRHHPREFRIAKLISNYPTRVSGGSGTHSFDSLLIFPRSSSHSLATVNSAGSGEASYLSSVPVKISCATIYQARYVCARTGSAIGRVRWPRKEGAAAPQGGRILYERRL